MSGNSHKFAPWSVSTRRRFPSYLFYANHCQRKMGCRLALKQELARSLARSLVLVAFARPSLSHRLRTYCADVWHSRYVRMSYLLAGHTWLALIYVCTVPTLCAPAGRGALFITRMANCVIGPSPLIFFPSLWSPRLSLILYV